jgi:hypothetical protein
LLPQYTDDKVRLTENQMGMVGLVFH